MHVPPAEPRAAWQPLTPAGVAAFAGATFVRLLAVAAAVAAIVAVTVGAFCSDVWFPTVREAIARLPETGEIRQGRLAWPGERVVLLAEGRALSIVVDLDHRGELGREADFSLQFGLADLRVWSLLGYVDFAYPASYRIAASRGDLEPWWAAREPLLLAGIFAATLLALLLLWALLATACCGPVWVVAFFGNRRLTLAGAWKLAAAAQLPGALLLAVLVLGYTFGTLSLIRFSFGVLLHFIVGWVFALVSPGCLPEDTTTRKPKENPFTTGGGQNAAPRAPKEKNPFAG